MSQEILITAEEKMKKAVEVYSENLKTIRTGRPNPEIFKKVKVECYGTPMGLQDVASISVPDGQSFVIQPFDKTNLKAIEKGIIEAELGLSPNNDGNQIRVPVPALTAERRSELVKQVIKMAEEKGRLPVRNIRGDSRERLKKLKGDGISEDEIKKLQDDLEKLTGKYVAQVDDLTSKKEKDLQTV